MKLRLCHDIDVRPNKTGTLALSDPWRGSGHDSFSAGDIHELKEEPSEVLDDPLHYSKLRCDPSANSGSQV